MAKKIIYIHIRRDQQLWLRRHPVINLSGLVQQILNEEQTKDKPFHYNIKKKTAGGGVARNVGIAVSISSENKSWLDTVKTSRKGKQFLSAYIRKRIDYIMDTGIINMTMTFRKTVQKI